MTIYSNTTLAELLDELEMGSPHMGAAIRERVAELQDELEEARDNASPGWDACPNCEENEAAAEGLATRADELAARVDELEAELKGAQTAAMTGPVIPADQWPDEFKGDNAKLIGCISALLSMDAAGALVPHGIGAHARSLLAAAAHRLAPAPAIDLGQFREAVESLRLGATRPEHHEECDRLLALIDGQPSVRSSSEHNSEVATDLALIDGQSKCLTCSGHGLIGSASADGGAGHGEACPDCSNEQSTKGDGQAAPRPMIARQLAEWHEDDGPVMWWAWCGSDWAGEPAWCGTPNDCDWPGYHTHWIPHPAMPMQPTKGEGVDGE